MIRQQGRVLNSVSRIREVIVTQRAALAEQQSNEYAHTADSETDDVFSFAKEISGYYKKLVALRGLKAKDVLVHESIP